MNSKRSLIYFNIEYLKNHIQNQNFVLWLSMDFRLILVYRHFTIQGLRLSRGIQSFFASLKNKHTQHHFWLISSQIILSYIIKVHHFLSFSSF